MDRRATLTLGSAKTDRLELGSKGTPQGAVLPPLLFNLELRGLPEALEGVLGVEHTIYADDITLWCRERSDAEIEKKLQAAAKVVEYYAEECGLHCALEKSELLVFRNPYESVPEHIEVSVGGKRVSKPTEIRLLGQLIRQGRGKRSTIDKLDIMTTQVCGMLRKTRNRRRCIKEKEAIQVVQALINSRINYATPYLVVTKAERRKIDVLISKAYKSALGLPERTETEKLLKLRLHNTIDELHEAHLVAQLKRLASMRNGTWFMNKLEMAVPGGTHTGDDPDHELSAEIRRRIIVS